MKRGWCFGTAESTVHDTGIPHPSVVQTPGCTIPEPPSRRCPKCLWSFHASACFRLLAQNSLLQWCGAWMTKRRETSLCLSPSSLPLKLKSAEPSEHCIGSRCYMFFSNIFFGYFWAVDHIQLFHCFNSFVTIQ